MLTLEKDILRRLFEKKKKKKPYNWTVRTSEIQQRNMRVTEQNCIEFYKSFADVPLLKIKNIFIFRNIFFAARCVHMLLLVPGIQQNDL